MSRKIAAAEDCVQQELLTYANCQDQEREGRFSPIRYAAEKNRAVIARLSRAELDEATELIDGDPQEFCAL